MTSLTFEHLITTADGQSASRALVKVIIDQQIGQQISVMAVFLCLWACGINVCIA
jgi:hypothetical protein